MTKVGGWCGSWAVGWEMDGFINDFGHSARSQLATPYSPAEQRHRSLPAGAYGSHGADRGSQRRICGYPHSCSYGGGKVIFGHSANTLSSTQQNPITHPLIA